jgi:small subunit ribosomal protein S2
MSEVTRAIAEGLAERKSEKAADKENKSADAPQPEKEVKTEAKEAKPEAKEAKPAPEKETVVAEKETAVAEEPKKEAPKKEETATTDIDLTLIEGIGPKTAEALTNAGLNSFEILAGADPERIKEILTEASSRLAHLDPGSWPKQAKMVAEGKLEELKEWQESVKGGVE